MNNLKIGRIYCIQSEHTDKVYIGSTIETLSRRLSVHVLDFKNWKNGKKKYISSFEIMEFDDYYISLIEIYHFNLIEELRSREGYYQRIIECVNKRIAGRTLLQYYLENNEEIKQRNKKYYLENKNAIDIYQKQYRDDHKEKQKEYITQYVKDNKEELAQKHKEYRLKNIEKIKDYKKIKMTCECGSVFNKNAKSEHLKSLKHKNYIPLCVF